MYEKLVKKLRRCGKGLCTEDCPDWTKENLYHTCQDELVLEAADAIEELTGFVQEAERDRDEYRERLDKANDLMQKQWIPVTKRLPEIDMSYPHHEDYLVQYDSGNMDVASWSNVNRFWTDHVTEPHWNCVQFAEVIAWMPLPEPPMEEET